VLVWQAILRFTQNDRSTSHKGFTSRIRVELFLYFLTAENAEYTEINSNFVVFYIIKVLFSAVSANSAVNSVILEHYPLLGEKGRIDVFC
ncbi:MAG: hypothetical protein AAB110_02725, partial [Candidatus Desantisbacteria bacterium]